MQVTAVFLLSPARCSGERANMLVRSGSSELGRQLRERAASIGAVFSWLSALYFRGKLTYAQRFGRALVMTPGFGLRSPETLLSVAAFRAMGKDDIESGEFV